MTEFAQQVCSVVAKIPKGETLTYKQVADRAGHPNACRAVGNILNKNRNPSVPCHRVIRSDGQIGGFAFGTPRKIQKLSEEGYYPARDLIKNSKNTILDQFFFNRPTLEVAEDLIGKFLVRSINGKETRIIINEVEAYDGPDDLACHASKGKTQRTKIMFGPAGRYYVYLCYGMHWMLNIVTGPKDYPAAILIRGAGDHDGPAKLTKALNINGSHNGKPAREKTGLWIEENPFQIYEKITKTPRIGVDYAGPIWSKVPYRFVLNSSLEIDPSQKTN